MLNTVQRCECAGSLEPSMRKMWNKYRTTIRQESILPCQEIWDQKNACLIQEGVTNEIK